MFFSWDTVWNLQDNLKPNRAEVEAAVRTIIRWSGDNPERDGLIETPARVTRALEEAFVGYGQDPAAVVEIYARRLQIQERFTAQIANVIERVLTPRGVGV